MNHHQQIKNNMARKSSPHPTFLTHCHPPSFGLNCAGKDTLGMRGFWKEAGSCCAHALSPIAGDSGSVRIAFRHGENNALSANNFGRDCALAGCTGCPNSPLSSLSETAHLGLGSPLDGVHSASKALPKSVHSSSSHFALKVAWN